MHKLLLLHIRTAMVFINQTASYDVWFLFQRFNLCCLVKSKRQVAYTFFDLSIPVLDSVELCYGPFVNICLLLFFCLPFYSLELSIDSNSNSRHSNHHQHHHNRNSNSSGSSGATTALPTADTNTTSSSSSSIRSSTFNLRLVRATQLLLPRNRTLRCMHTNTYTHTGMLCNFICRHHLIIHNSMRAH